MKRIILSLSFIAVVATVSAQDEKFQGAMMQAITMLDSAKTTEDLTDVAARFERIGDAETTQWLPYYYAALADVWIGFRDQKANKDALADKADILISKAQSLQPKSAEVYTVKSMAATLHLIVDPKNRWQKYGADSKEALGMAKQLDPANPRIYFLEGQSLFGTPEAFGGGKDKAKPMFEKAVELFKTFRPASSIHPTWGEAAAKQMLEACKG